MEQKKKISSSWYLLYTNPRAEKKVEFELKKRGYMVYLPQRKILKQWSDRKKWIEEPLFKSYIFIFTEIERNYYEILSIPGVVKFINFEKKPAIVDFREVELVKLMLSNFDELESWESSDFDEIELGETLEIFAGPLIGNYGKLVNRYGKKSLLIELSSIQQKLIVTVPEKFLRKIEPNFAKNIVNYA
jgi:transcription antitermination factor NusG